MLMGNSYDYDYGDDYEDKDADKKENDKGNKDTEGNKVNEDLDVLVLPRHPTMTIRWSSRTQGKIRGWYI